MNFKQKILVSKQQKNAFTLIELLIVIAIIGILFVVLVSRVDFATDKAKATGVQTDFRAFQVAFEQVAKENKGFNGLGWDMGDISDDSLWSGKTTPDGQTYSYANQTNDHGDRIRNAYDIGDANLNGIQEAGETWVGRKIYTETWTGTYTLVKPGTTTYDSDAIMALETAINANLDPKLHITIANNGIITMANQARDPWGKEYHGRYQSYAAKDSLDSGVIIMYSDGANGLNGSADGVQGGLVNIVTPNNNVNGQDDYALATMYTYANGYGEVVSISKGFSNNQEFGDAKDVPVTPVGEVPAVQVPGGAGGSGGSTPSYNHNAPELHPVGIDLDGTGRTVPQSGDTYKYGNYEYIYETFYFEPEKNGWKVQITDTNQTTYGAILESINGTPVTSLYNTFSGCTKLIAAPVIPTSVKNMNNTFLNCTSLETAPAIPSSVTSMSCTFASCTSLITAPDMSNAISVTDMSCTFRGCKSLETAPAIPSSVTDLDRTFAFCTSLITAPDMSNAISVTNMSQTFHQCKLLITVPNLSNCIQLTNMYYTFAECKSLTDLSSFVIPSSVTNMESTFQNCSSLIAAPAIPSSVTNIDSVFWCCELLKGTIEINANPTEYTGALYMDTQITGITGSTTMADNIMKTRTSTATNPTAQ